MHNEGCSKKPKETNNSPDMLNDWKRGRYQKKMIGREEFEFTFWHKRYFIWKFCFYYWNENGFKTCKKIASIIKS